MIKVKIGNKLIGKNEPCFISLEPSATYTNVNEAKKMIQEAASAGADAIKFQTFLSGDAERIMGDKEITIDFSTKTSKKKELVYEALKRRELTKNEWKELVTFARNLNMLFITAPYFVETVDFLTELKVDAIKVSKGDINNVILIDQMSRANLPVILDAREKLEDIDRAIKICENNNNNKIIIMHCPSGYPVENSGVHLNAIKFLQEIYDYPIGFADHSPGDTMNYAAIALGATMIEKTITIDKTIEHIEHFMSLELNELKTFIVNVRALEKAMGDPSILKTSRVEDTAKRSIVAKRNIVRGERITQELIDFKRPGYIGISCAEGFNVLTKKAKTNIPEGTFLQWTMLE